MEISVHAAQRLEERGITEEMIDDVLKRPLGSPDPGNNGNLVYVGAVAGRYLCVVVSPDHGTLVSSYWKGVP